MGDKSMFIEENKNAVIEEMGSSINMMNQVINSIVETPNDESGEYAIKKLMMVLSHQIGSLTMLYNEFYILHTGIIPSDQEEQRIGFTAMHDKQDKKNKKGED